MTFKITDRCKVNLLDYHGSDRAIARRAWCATGKDNERSEEDEKLLVKNLIKLGHTKPFELVHFDFHVELPIFLDRQLCTYRLIDGSIAKSNRYQTEKSITFFVPKETSLDIDYMECLHNITEVYHKVMSTSQNNVGRKNELARNILPTSLITSRAFTVNLVELAHILSQRLDKHAQLEMRDLAMQIHDAVIELPNLQSAIRTLDSNKWRFGNGN